MLVEPLISLPMISNDRADRCADGLDEVSIVDVVDERRLRGHGHVMNHDTANAFESDERVNAAVDATDDEASCALKTKILRVGLS